MYVNSLNQLISFFVFFISGCFIGVIFDIFRVLRKSFKTSDIITYIEDIIFGILTMIIILSSIFKFNNGELRLYIFIATMLGLMFYILLISRFFIKVNVTIVIHLKKIFKNVLRILIYPINILNRMLKKILIRPFYIVFINLRYISTKKVKKIKNSLKKYRNSKKALKKEGI